MHSAFPVTIASDFGNLAYALIGLPILFVAFLAGLFGALGRIRWISLGSGFVCIAVAALFFLSVSDARERDKGELQFLAQASLGAGIVVLSGLLLPRR